MRHVPVLKKTGQMPCRIRRLIRCAMHWPSSGRLFHGCLKPLLCLSLCCISTTRPVIAGLLVFNAALAYFQEGRAQATLAALKSRLALNASVQRDGAWKTVPAAELVCGDLVKLSLGGVVAADVHLTGGSVELDQSMLTGESLPIEAGPGADTFAGALVRRGEAKPW
jgi:magnesium-transporting ATPase (P-type)